MPADRGEAPYGATRLKQALWNITKSGQDAGLTGSKWGGLPWSKNIEDRRQDPKTHGPMQNWGLFNSNDYSKDLQTPAVLGHLQNTQLSDEAGFRDMGSFQSSTLGTKY